MIDAVQLLNAVKFASEKHAHQRRKDAEASPYINHPIAVATVLAVESSVTDHAVIVAAVLHDTVEDTETTFEELEKFGSEVRALVAEVTDDKSLPKDERKMQQIAHARMASVGAKQIKIADKICNIRDIAKSPPVDWPVSRKDEYLDWATRVVDGCRRVNPALDAAFDTAVAHARRALGGSAQERTR